MTTRDEASKLPVHPASQTREIFLRPGFDPFSGAAYLFDIDGTLLNTQDGVHWNAFRHVLREVFGIESLLDTIPVHGNTDIGILRAVAGQHGIEPAYFERELPRALGIMRREVERNGTDIRCELCHGVRDLLEELHRRGKVLGVVSGNLEGIGWRKISAAGLREFFAFGAFSDAAEQRVDIFRHGMSQAKQLLTAGNGQGSSDYWPLTTGHCIFIGDTHADIGAARALGMPIIAVATGIYSFTDLLASSPDACVPCCSDLLHRHEEQSRGET
jgi:phosphoglycolate phosphatase